MVTPVSALDLVGGAAVIGGEAAPGVDMVRLIRRGLPVGAVQFVLDSGRLTLGEIDQIVLPRKTLASRRKLGNLTPEQSDRLVRVARVLAAAEGDVWHPGEGRGLAAPPNARLGGRNSSYCNLLDTEEGAREVETLLGRIGHGIAA